MTKEDFEKLKSTVKQWLFHTGSLDPTNYANELKLKFIEPKEKRIEELTEWLNDASDEKLKKENTELKERADKADLDSVLFFNQLCKAKAIIKDYIVATADHCTACSVPEENRCINVFKLNEQAEHFLKEVSE